MNEFSIWFSTGVTHILDLQGYDHILFVTLLALTFPPGRWKGLLLLITAFTIGHSISLALSVTGHIYLPQPFIECCIALSILATAIYNGVHYKNTSPPTAPLFGVILLFGLIHGLGFSYLLKSMLGKEQSVVLPLLYFNTGLEIGQLIIVAVVIFSLFLAQLFKWQFNIYKLVIVCIIGFIALKISATRFLDLFQSS